MQQPTETKHATEPLPLFRPEVLCRQERFFGEVLLIRPFSFRFLGWLVIGAAALTYGVLFFSTDSAHGAEVKLAFPIAKRRLVELFKPSKPLAVPGKSQR